MTPSEKTDHAALMLRHLEGQSLTAAPRYDDNYKRFHLLFAYDNGRGGKSTGDQVVFEETLEKAAQRIGRERGVKEVEVRKRYFSGKPASAAEIINQTFTV